MNYDAVAPFYDRFNGAFDYSRYLDTVFSSVSLPGPLVLDLGCGTGSLLCALAQRGFDGTGVDCSEEMLSCAAEKLSENGITPHLVCQEIEDLDLYGAYHGIFCTQDVLNHLSLPDLRRFFARIHCFAEPGAYLIFDLKKEAAFAPKTDCFENDGTVLFYRRLYRRPYAETELTLFSPTDDGTYDRCDEIIRERFLSRSELRDLLKNSGFSLKKTVNEKDRTLYFCRKEDR